MINDLSNSLADRMVNLSPEVRAFCEQNSRKIAGEPPRFQTMADAWVFLVLEGLKSGVKYEGELKRTKDAFRWRVVNSDFQNILLLYGLCQLKSANVLTYLSAESSEIILALEEFAHQGALLASER